MAIHFNLNDFVKRNDNPFDMNLEEAIPMIYNLCSRVNKKCKSATIDGYKIQRLPKEYLENYLPGDRAFTIDFPMSKDWECAMVEVHFLNGRENKIFIVM